ncbi:MAG: hypothetical protein ACRDUB_18060 [Mycobacterium sp.]
MLCGLLGGFRVAPVDDDVGTLGRQQLGDGQPDSPGAADDDCGAAGQQTANRPSPR